MWQETYHHSRAKESYGELLERTTEDSDWSQLSHTERHQEKRTNPEAESKGRTELKASSYGRTRGASTLSCDFMGPFQRCDLYFSNIPTVCEGRGWDRVDPAAWLVTLLSACVVRAGWSSTPLVVNLLSDGLVSMKRAGSTIFLDAPGVPVWCSGSSCLRELCHFPYGTLRELTISPTVK